MRTFFTLGKILLFLAPVAVSAQGYQPLAPLSLGGQELTSLGGYLSDLFLLGIGLAGVLAVVMLIIAGIQFIGGASSESQRKDAKDRIWAAILGLLIALGAWMILSTINSDLINVPNASLQPKPIDTSSAGSSRVSNKDVGDIAYSERALRKSIADIETRLGELNNLTSLTSEQQQEKTDLLLKLQNDNKNLAEVLSKSDATRKALEEELRCQPKFVWEWLGCSGDNRYKVATEQCALSAGVGTSCCAYVDVGCSIN